MMFCGAVPGLSYVLPLKSLDINHLGLNYSQWNRKPQWHSEKDLTVDSKYYQVEIILEEDALHNSYELYTRIKCEPCNTYIPTSYIEQHKQSKKHENHTKKHAIIQERISKQNLDGNIPQIPNNSYYCDVCCKIIKKEDKILHEQSKEHTFLKEQEKMVEDFLKIYITPTNCDKNNKNIELYEKNDVKLNSNIDTFSNSLNKIRRNEIIIDNSEVNKTKVDDKESIEIISNMDNITKTLTENIQNKLYEAIENVSLTNKSKSNKDVSDNDSITNSDDDDEFVILNITNESDEIKIKTRLSFENEENIDHNNLTKSENTPVTNSTKIVKNDNPTKKNDNKSKKIDFKTHLDVYIEKYGLKTNAPTILNDTVLIKNIKNEELNVSLDSYNSYRIMGDTAYCQMCRMWISRDTKIHDITDGHMRNILQDVSENWARKIDPIYSHCVICNEIILTLSDHHNLNEEHKTILDNKLLSKQSENERKYSEIYCNCCEIYTDANAYIEHFASKDHKMKQDFYRRKNIGKENISNGKVKVLKSLKYKKGSHLKVNVASENNSNVANVNNGKPSVDSVENNTKVKAATENKVKAINVKVNVASDNKTIVKAAVNNDKNSVATVENKTKVNVASVTVNKVKSNVSITNNVKGNVANESNGKPSVASTNNTKVNGVINNIKPSVSTEESKTKNINHIKDVTTKVNVATENNAKTNVASEKNNNFTNQNLFLFNKCKQINSDDLYCECCKKTLTDFMFHINSNEHVFNLVNDKSIAKIRNDLRKFIYESQYSSIINEKDSYIYRNFHKNLLRHDKLTEFNTSSYFCRLCKMNVLKIYDIEHVLSDSHKIKKIAELLSDAVCEKCNVL